jgi:uncharacterized protein YyaL (SSP411 family)
MELSLNKFWDKEEGGFFDTEGEIVEIRLKSIEDIPHPSANSLGIILLLKLFHMTGNEAYKSCAETSLTAFSSQAKDMDIHSGYFFCAMDAYFNMVKLNVQASPGNDLFQAALSTFRPYVSLVYGEDKGIVIPCARDVCHEPIYSPEKLKHFLQSK